MAERELSLTAAAVWNAASAVATVIILFYSYRLYATFKGGKLSRLHGFIMAAISVALLTFVVSFAFSYAGISPTQLYGISVKDAGVLVALVLLGLALRESAKFWSLSAPMGR